jgi:hypothetical protein
MPRIVADRTIFSRRKGHGFVSGIDIRMMFDAFELDDESDVRRINRIKAPIFGSDFRFSGPLMT